VKKLVTPFRVGLLVIVAGASFFAFFMFARKGGLNEKESTRVWAYFRDASGLSAKSRVQIAGIPVGEINQITLEGTRAKVWLRIRKDVDLREDAVLTKRSESLLGDYLLDLNPGTEQAQPMQDNGQIRRVIDTQGMEAVFQSLSQITADIQQVTAALRDVLGGEKGAGSLQRSPSVRRPHRHRGRSELRRREDGIDLGMPLVRGYSGVEQALAVARGEVAIDINVAADVTIEPRPGQTELRDQLRADHARSQIRVGARCVGDPRQALPLGDVLAAMIRRQRHRIIDSARIEQSEEIAQLAVELEQLQAHLLPFGAEGVADIIRRRQADREDIGSRPTP